MGDSAYLLAAGLEFFFTLISIILLVGCLLDHDRNRKTNRIMVFILIFHALMHIIDACIWIWCDVPSLLLIMKVFSFLSYGLGCVVIVLFSLLLVAFIREATPVWIWVEKAIYGTGALMILLWFISLFNDMYYYWDENGICQQGNLFWLSQAFGVLFFLFNIVLVLCYRRALGRKDTTVLMFYNVIPLFSFFLIQYWDVTPLYASTTIVLLLYYVILHAEHGQRIAEQEAQLFKQELELVNSRNAIVLSQIRPHFLYNSLTAIAQLCEKDPGKAKETTLNFSEYLRQNMKSLDQKGPIPFKDELKHVKNYLAIEQVRFGDDLHIVYNLGVTDFLIPPLSLQPIIENAVKHGVGKKEDGGTVSITTKEADDCYELTVSDDGAGFDYNEDMSNDLHHSGMRLVQIRLKNLVNGTMHIDSCPGKGTTIMICIPKNQ